MDKRKAIQNIRELFELLPQAFLSNGTLLGAVREEDILSHDLDTDLGMKIEDWTPDIIDKAINAGFVLDHEFGTYEDGLQYSFKRDNIKTDLFFYYQNEKGTWHAVYGGYDLQQRRYQFPNIIGFTKLKLQDEEFDAPINYNSFLEAQYGEDWLTTVKDWDYWTSPHNLYEP